MCLVPISVHPPSHHLYTFPSSKSICRLCVQDFLEHTFRGPCLRDASVSWRCAEVVCLQLRNIGVTLYATVATMHVSSCRMSPMYADIGLQKSVSSHESSCFKKKWGKTLGIRSRRCEDCGRCKCISRLFSLHALAGSSWWAGFTRLEVSLMLRPLLLVYKEGGANFSQL